MGKPSPKYVIWIGVLAVAILAGLYLTYRVLTEGLVLYGATDDVMWTLPLAVYAFFSLTSTGLALVGAAPQVFNLERFKPITKRAILLSIAALIAAGVSMLLELGSPFNMVKFLVSPNPTSTIWWLGVFYTLHLVFLVALVWSGRSGSPSRIVATLVFLQALVTAITVGATFGLTEARPVYFGTFVPIYFLVVALLNGVATILLVNLVLAQFTALSPGEAQAALFDDLAKILGVLTAVALILVGWRTLVGLYTHLPEYEGFKHLIGSWPYQFQLWLGLVLPLALLAIPALRRGPWSKLLAAALVLAGVFLGGMQLVESGLSVPTGARLNGVPAIEQVSTTAWEWMVVVFALAVMLLFYTLGERYLQVETSG